MRPPSRRSLDGSVTVTRIVLTPPPRLNACTTLTSAQTSTRVRFEDPDDLPVAVSETDGRAKVDAGEFSAARRPSLLAGFKRPTRRLSPRDAPRTRSVPTPRPRFAGVPRRFGIRDVPTHRRRHAHLRDDVCDSRSRFPAGIRRAAHGPARRRSIRARRDPRPSRNRHQHATTPAMPTMITMTSRVASAGCAGS